MDDSLKQTQPEETVSPTPQQSFSADTTSWSPKCIALMQSGVTITDPSHTTIAEEVEIGQDSTILPGCQIEGSTHIGTDCQIGPNVTIITCQIGNGVRIQNSTRLENMTIGANTIIEPFQHLIGPKQ